MTRTIYPLTLFYDAACPVCSFEVDCLRDRSRDGKLVFVDIAAPGFDPSAHGATAAGMGAEIHGLCADGTMLRGVEVMRHAYDAADLGWVLRPTGWPMLRPFFDASYRVFARHRHEISRAAAPLVVVLRGLRARRARRTARRMSECADGACDIHGGNRRTS